MTRKTDRQHGKPPGGSRTGIDLRRFRPRPLATIVTLVFVAILLGLGSWQLDRRAWKQDLIADIDARLEAPPIPLPAEIEDPEGLAYRPILLSGEFLADRELHVVSRTQNGRVGLHVITPLELEDGRQVLVNRGWVPESRRDPASRPESLPEGAVTLEGLARAGGWDGMEFLRPSNDAANNAWLWMDLPAMARAADLERPVTEVYVDLRPVQADGGRDAADLPVAGQSTIDLPDNHLQYALTWFSLALALVGIYVISQCRPRD